MKKLLQFAAAVALLACGLIVGTTHGAVSAASAVPSFTVLSEGGSYEPLNTFADTVYAVKCDGAGCPRNTVYKTTDEGRTWTACAPLPNQVFTISRLHSGTLIATSEAASRPWRSTDGCATWQAVQIADPAHPGAYLSRLPISSTLRYYLLSNDSLTDDGTYAYIATYSSPLAGVTVPEANLTNYVYRSADDGQTWEIASVSTNHKHFHGIVSVPGGPLDALTGDNWGCATNPAMCVDGIYVSRDFGATFKQVCPTCITTDAAFSKDGLSLVFDTDEKFATNQIESLNLATGIPTVLAQVPYEAVGADALRTSDGTILLGTDYEGGVGYKKGPDGTLDKNLHVYAVTPDGTVTSVLSRPIPSTTLDGHLEVKGVLSNGDVVIYRSGYGAIFGRFTSGVTAPPPPATTATATTTATEPITTTEPTTTSCVTSP